MLKFVIATSIALCSGPVCASSTKGVVVYDKGCNSRMIIETTQGYVLAEWYGGSTPSKGDVIVGDLNSYGMKEVFIYNRDSDLKIWIDDYGLSRARVVEKLADKCS